MDFALQVPDVLLHKMMKFACDSYNMRHDWTGESPYSKFHGKNYSMELLTRYFGEIVVASNNNARSDSDFNKVGMIVGRDMASENSYEFFDLETKTISMKAKFVPVTVELDKYVKMVKELDHHLVFGINEGKHAKASTADGKMSEFEEIDEVREEDKDIDPALAGKYSKNKTWTIEKLLYHYMRNDIKFFRVKWLGFKLLDDSCDMSESQLLASHSMQDLKAIPSLRTYKKKHRGSKMVFITKVSINPRVQSAIDEAKERSVVRSTNK